MSASPPIAPAPVSLFDRLAARELPQPTDATTPVSLRVRLPYPFEAMPTNDTAEDAPAVGVAIPGIAPRSQQQDGDPHGSSPRPTTDRSSVAEADPRRLSKQTYVKQAPETHTLSATPPASPRSPQTTADKIAPAVVFSQRQATDVDATTGAGLHTARAQTRTSRASLDPAKHSDEKRTHHRGALLPAAANVLRDPVPVVSTPTLRPASQSTRVPPLSAQAQPAREPTIEIHIGRLEVRAQRAPAPSAPSSRPVPAQEDRLSAYLGRRARGARS